MADLRGKSEDEKEEALKGNQITHMKSATILEEKADDEEQEEKDEEKLAVPLWDCGSPLYDSYELVSLTHLIERHLMVVPSCDGSKTLFTLTNPSHEMVSTMVRKTVSSEKNSEGSFRITSWSEFVVKKMKIRKKKGNGERRKKPKEKTSGVARCCSFWRN